jgi:hypothetical protein
MIRYDVVGLMYTRTCPLACRDCIVSSSPKAKGKMDPAVARAYLEVIPTYSDSVCFTGGEPMLYYNEVAPLIREAKQIGLKVSMVTGAGWARVSKKQIARDRIFGLKDAGLDTLCVSWDVYHEEFSDPENALLVLELAKEAGLRSVVRGVMPATGPIARIEEKLIAIKIGYQKVPVVRLGSAATLPDDHFTFTEESPAGGCSVIYSPVVEPDGMVYACCGPSRWSKPTSPLFLGSTDDEDLDTIFNRAVRDPLLEALATIGPYGLMRLIKDDPSIQDILPIRAQGYTGMCELCLDLNNIPEIVEHIRERLSTFQMRTMINAAMLYQSASNELKELGAPTV